jgi:RNA polymerase sigma factor, sigma-70 family
MSKPTDRLITGIHGEISTKQERTVHPEIPPDFIRDLKEGEEKAFYQLVTRYTGQLRDYIYHWLDRYEDAEEVTQDVFLYLWEHRRNLTCDSLPQLLKYIYIAGKTQAIRILREKKRHQRYCEYMHAQPHGFTESPDHIVEVKQAEQATQNVLRRMPRIRATTYEMRYNEGCSYAEISMKLNITESTARSHVNHAVRDIRQALKECGL